MAVDYMRSERPDNFCDPTDLPQVDSRLPMCVINSYVMLLKFIGKRSKPIETNDCSMKVLAVFEDQFTDHYFHPRAAQRMENVEYAWFWV